MISFKRFLLTEWNALQMKTFSEEPRRSNFLKQYKSITPFELAKGDEKNPETVTLKFVQEIYDILDQNTDPKKIKKLMKDLGYVKGQSLMFPTVDGKMISLSKLAKTPDFGGISKTSKSGTHATKKNECGQAIYIAAALNGSSDFSDKDLGKAISSVAIDADPNDSLDIDDNWKASHIATAKAVKKFMGGGSGYMVHRGDKWMKTLYKSAMKLDYQKAFGDENKWNPGDIWITSPKGRGFDFSKCQSLVELNEVLMEMFESRDIVGVSLKLIDGSKAVKLTEYNGKNFQFETTYQGYKVQAKPNSFHGNKATYLFYNFQNHDYEIEFRTASSGMKDFRGEVKAKGAKSRGGRGGIAQINYILSNLGLGRELPREGSIRSAARKYDPKLIKALYALYLKYTTDGSKMSYEDFHEATITRGQDARKPTPAYEWLYSKYMALRMVDIILKSHSEDAFCKMLAQYAMSATDLSSVYIKTEQ